MIIDVNDSATRILNDSKHMVTNLVSSCVYEQEDNATEDYKILLQSTITYNKLLKEEKSMLLNDSGQLYTQPPDNGWSDAHFKNSIAKRSHPSV